LNKIPLVSILIPSYNSAVYIEQCIESALSQTYGNIEIILQDDCSTDGTWESVQKYDGRVKLFKNGRNLGNTGNHNDIFDKCAGEYYIFLHNDDYILPGFIEKAVSLHTEHRNLSMVIGERMLVEENGEPYSIAPFYNTSCIIPGVEQARVFMMTSMVLSCQVVGKSECFVRTNKMASIADAQIFFEMALQGDVGYIKEPMAVYRNRKNSTTDLFNKGMGFAAHLYDGVAAINKIASKHPYLSQFCEAAEKNIARHLIRYAQKFFENRNYELCRKYLTQALVYDGDSIKDHTYRTLEYCVGSVAVNPDELYEKVKGTLTVNYVRTYSYDSPEGHKQIKNI
jgi:glycosyltransferase involved in cell wall biosynthesis